MSRQKITMPKFESVSIDPKLPGYRLEMHGCEHGPAFVEIIYQEKIRDCFYLEPRYQRDDNYPDFPNYLEIKKYIVENRKSLLREWQRIHWELPVVRHWKQVRYRNFRGKRHIKLVLRPRKIVWNFCHVVKVIPYRDYTLDLRFNDGTWKHFDMLQVIREERPPARYYYPLIDPKNFMCCIADGSSVMWNGNIDMAPEHFYRDGVEISANGNAPRTYQPMERDVTELEILQKLEEHRRWMSSSQKSPTEILAIRPHDDYTLDVKFRDGTCKNYDYRQRIFHPHSRRRFYAPLKSIKNFKKVVFVIDPTWDGGIRFYGDSNLYHQNGIQIEDWTSSPTAFSEKRIKIDGETR